MMMHTDAGCLFALGGVVAMGVLIAAALGEVVWGRWVSDFKRQK